MRFCFGENDGSNDGSVPERIGPVREKFPEPKAWEPTLEEFLNIAPLESGTCKAQLSSAKKSRRAKVRRSWGGAADDAGFGANFEALSRESQTNRKGDSAAPAESEAADAKPGAIEGTAGDASPVKAVSKSSARIVPAASTQPSPPRSSVCLASLISSSAPARGVSVATGAARASGSPVDISSSSVGAQEEFRPRSVSSGRGATIRVVSSAAVGGGVGGGAVAAGTRLFASGGAALPGSYSSLSYATSSRGLSAQLGMQRSVSTGCLVSFGRPAPASVGGTVIGGLAAIAAESTSLSPPPPLLPASLPGKEVVSEGS